MSESQGGVSHQSHVKLPVYPSHAELERLAKAKVISKHHKAGLDAYRSGGSLRYAQLAYLEAFGNLTPELKAELDVFKRGGGDREALLTRLEFSECMTPVLQAELERLRASRALS